MQLVGDLPTPKSWQGLSLVPSKALAGSDPHALLSQWRPISAKTLFAAGLTLCYAIVLIGVDTKLKLQRHAIPACNKNTQNCCEFDAARRAGEPCCRKQAVKKARKQMAESLA